VSQADVDQLVALTGGDVATCRAALSRTRGNADLAASLIFEGFTAEDDEDDEDEGAGLVTGSSSSSGAEATGSSSSSGGAGLDRLRSLPIWNQIRRAVQSNPAAIGQAMAAIRAIDPALFELANSNRVDFLRMLNEPVTSDGDDDDDGGDDGTGMPPELRAILEPGNLGKILAILTPEQRTTLSTQIGIPAASFASIASALSMASAARGAAGPGGAPGGRGPVRISLSAAELQEVRELQELGFTEQQALQAYIVCNKNKELAASFLFENAA
jgi:hypothetical protein